jgi:hypothetical protein
MLKVENCYRIYQFITLILPLTFGIILLSLLMDKDQLADNLTLLITVF